MSLSLHKLKPTPGSKKKRKLIGRGCKRGTYSGRGLKGQRSRSGGKSGLKRKGMRQLIERTHKLKGFKSKRPKPAIVSLAIISDNFKNGDTITPRVLFNKKLIPEIRKGVKILLNGEIKVTITLKDCQVSKSAKTAIEKAGGQAKELIKQKINKSKKDKKHKK